jgi:hypothetical protein
MIKREFLITSSNSLVRMPKNRILAESSEKSQAHRRLAPAEARSRAAPHGAAGRGGLNGGFSRACGFELT